MTLPSHTKACGAYETGTKLFSLIEFPCLGGLVVSFSVIRYATCSYPCHSTQMSLSSDHYNSSLKAMILDIKLSRLYL